MKLEMDSRRIINWIQDGFKMDSKSDVRFLTYDKSYFYAKMINK